MCDICVLNKNNENDKLRQELETAYERLDEIATFILDMAKGLEQALEKSE